MYYLACTRFNNSTYEENMQYRKKNNYPVIYGSTLKIRDIYLPGSLIFVVEMNNEKNQIEGIALIENSLVCDRYHKIYDNPEYNKYIYRGKYWLSREMLDPEITKIFDTILFKGKSHLKCRIGITIITEKLLIRWNYDILTIKHRIQKIFENTFIKIKDKKEDTDTKNTDIKDNIIKVKDTDIKNDVKEDDDEIEFIIIPKKRKRTNISNKNIEI